ncbi:MAG: hypothetical protein HOM01_15065 [Kordiimonadaceae bacterium]|jgi:hypothetical protein|nr:hypothetical protein [Kordiimonadaceae bacterium]
MPNDFDSNFTRKLAKSFLKQFESNRILSKNVDTQLLAGKYDPDSGDNYDFKRPTDYKSVRTSDGDVSGETANTIITGKATGTVQDYFTTFVDYNEADEAIKMGGLDKLLAPLATRIVTDLEVDFAAFMMKNSALLAGAVGNAVNTWSEVARAGAVMKANGVPMDAPWCYAVNPYTQVALADVQRSLGAGDSLVSDAHRKAIIAENFGGLTVLSATTLSSYTTGTGADRAGTLSANPTVTYVGAKDTMTQVLAVTAFQANLVVAAGETITITGRNRLNLSTRQAVLDESGAVVVWSGTVTAEVTLDGSGAGNLTVTGPAIYEADGAYNTTDSAAVSGDVVTLSGSADTLYQPNLFWHKQAFSIGSVPIKKLHSTDTLATTEDGLQFRVSRGVGFLENQQKVRVDFRPAYGVMNPFFAGQGFGVA